MYSITKLKKRRKSRSRKKQSYKSIIKLGRGRPPDWVSTTKNQESLLKLWPAKWKTVLQTETMKVKWSMWLLTIERIPLKEIQIQILNQTKVPKKRLTFLRKKTLTLTNSSPSKHLINTQTKFSRILKAKGALLKFKLTNFQIRFKTKNCPDRYQETHYRRNYISIRIIKLRNNKIWLL